MSGGETDRSAISGSLRGRQHAEKGVETLSARVRFWYGAGEGGITVTWTAFYGFYLYFLTDFVGVDPTLAGALVLLGTGVSAVLLPLYLVDRGA